MTTPDVHSDKLGVQVGFKNASNSHKCMKGSYAAAHRDIRENMLDLVETRCTMSKRGRRTCRPRRVPTEMNQEIMVSRVFSFAHRALRRGAVDEFVLTTVLLFVTVTLVRWLRDPESPFYLHNLDIALAVDGVISGAVLTAFIMSPIGRRSGGHMNPAVTVALWLMGAFRGRRVVPYVLAQLWGSVVGTGLARQVWGAAVSHTAVAHAVIRPAWQPSDVLAAEAGAMFALMVVVGFTMSRPGRAHLVPYVIGGSVATVIALLGPRSGGSINPARQLGPALFSGVTTDLWIYLTVPVVGAALGAAIHRCVSRRLRSRELADLRDGRVPGGLVVRRPPKLEPPNAEGGPITSEMTGLGVGQRPSSAEHRTASCTHG